MSANTSPTAKSSDAEKSQEFQELQAEVDKLKDCLKSERSKNADADRKEALSKE